MKRRLKSTAQIQILRTLSVFRYSKNYSQNRRVDIFELEGIQRETFFGFFIQSINPLNLFFLRYCSEKRVKLDLVG